MLFGCPRSPSGLTFGKGGVEYDVVVAVASSSQTITSVYTLSVQPASGSTLIFRTLDSEGTWEQGGTTLHFDAATPRASDPWPLILQHAISSVPVRIEMKDGRPFRVLDEEAWRGDVLSALDALPLPEEARQSGQAMVDPDGVIRDLLRTFPGVPSPGHWEREERIAGVLGTRSEVCESGDGEGLRISCEGRAVARRGGSAHLHEVRTSTSFMFDRRGLLEMESQYDGTLVVAGTQQGQVLDRPIAGRRLVMRK